MLLARCVALQAQPVAARDTMACLGTTAHMCIQHAAVMKTQIQPSVALCNVCAAINIQHVRDDHHL
jgi:hypothetical protein